MGVKITEKEGHKFALVGSLLTMGLAVITLIFLFVIYDLESISIGSLEIFQITMLILAGFVLPGVIFALGFLADRQILKFKLHNLIFGIVIIAIGAFILIIDAFFIVETLPTAISNEGEPSYPAFVAIITFLYLGIITVIICIYGGVQNLIAHLKNK